MHERIVAHVGGLISLRADRYYYTTSAYSTEGRDALKLFKANVCLLLHAEVSFKPDPNVIIKTGAVWLRVLKDGVILGVWTDCTYVEVIDVQR
jgi:hypothetical protein